MLSPHDQKGVPMMTVDPSVTYNNISSSLALFVMAFTATITITATFMATTIKNGKVVWFCETTFRLRYYTCII